MSGKNQAPVVFNWQSVSPVTGFLPTHPPGGSTPSGTISGTMASTNTIFSQIIDVSRMDNIGLEVNWVGSPVGTFSVLVSNSGINFNALTFDPALGQPAGSAAGEAVNITQLGFKYMMLKYVNSSGSGTLTVYGQVKDLN